MKRILALDGGGIRGVFTLEVLLRMETLLREHYKTLNLANAEKFVLRDHFDFFAGTSTGAIIATCLCWGMPVQRVLDMYVDEGRMMFDPLPWYNLKKYLFARFSPIKLTEMLKSLYLEEIEDRLCKNREKEDQCGNDREVDRHGQDHDDVTDSEEDTIVVKDGKKYRAAKLGSKLLLNERDGSGGRKFLLVVVRNATTGSAWPLTNNPDAKYNDLKRPDCNLKIPLWKLVRASTAAPTYFPEEVVQLGDTKSIFVDGSITPYTNPAVIAALTAILPGYCINWPTGPENIRLVSVGTIQFSSELRGKIPFMRRLLKLRHKGDPTPIEVKNPALWLGYNAKQVPDALLQGTAWQQDYLCRCLGQPMFGEQIDSEVGDLLHDPLLFPGAWFSYVRYNRSYKKKELEEVLRGDPRLANIDAVDGMPRLREIGQQYAEENVKLWHLI